MSPLSVVPVRSGRERRQFLDLPWQIYRDDPHWMPPLRMTVKELTGFSRHPFHEHNQVQTFLAHRDGQVIGRIAAIVNQAHIDRYQDRRGFFGFFECIDDQPVANALFDAARAWLADREIHDIRGPTNPSLNYECGLLVEGFDSPPFFMMTHNPQYYGRLIEGYGFRKVQDMYAFWGHMEMLKQLDQKLGFIIEESTRRLNLTTRCVDKKRFAQEVHTFLNLYNQSLGGTWGFTPMSDGEVNHVAKSLKMLIVPQLTSVAEVDGRMVGASFGLLDYNPRIKEINGKLFPFGFIKLLRNKRGIKRIRLISTNVLPEYQKWGVGLVLMNNLVRPVSDWGMEEAEFSWVLESNTLSAGSLRRGGAKLTKTYRLYDYGPTPDPQRSLYEGKSRKK
jgi:GNAT superfamily N-acetyltransferase